MPDVAVRLSTRLCLLVSAALGLALTSAQAAEPAATQPQAVATQEEPASFGPWGVNLSGRDMGAKPGNDFFRYANGTYLDHLKIPADMTSYGPFNALAELSRTRVQSILNDLSTHPVANPRTIEEKLGTFYASYMDTAQVERLGAQPLAPDLDAIRALKDMAGFAALTGSGVGNFQFSPFSLSINPDAKDPTRYALNLDQAGLGLPDRDYYLKPEFAAKKKAYQAYIEKALTLADWPGAASAAQAIVAFETRLAQVHWTRAALRDPQKTYNPMTLAELGAKAPGFDWATWLRAAGLNAQGLEARTLIVGEPDAMTGEARIVSTTDMDTLRAWLAFHLVDNTATYLPDRFEQARFEFTKALSGQPTLAARWKRGVQATSAAMGMALGKVYVQRYFPPESRASMQKLTADLKNAFRERLRTNTWMSPTTRDAALHKLESFEIQVGYPNTWRDYKSLGVRQGDVYGNARNGVAYEWRYWLERLDRPVDRNEWDMTPQTVNAYNNPLFVEVVFPAAILQPPFFNPKADAAVNYGAIGGVIGHEMTHSFDDEGRQFDEHGRLKDWWTKEDAERFQKLADRLGAQYDAFEVLPGVHVNGKLTMGENIADLGGLTLALDAYHASLGGKPAPVIDGLSGDQRVFLGWAQVWREKLRDDTVRRLAVTDPHSPPQARVNIPMHNIDAWYDAWDVKPGDTLYLAPQQRVKIW
ncbi:M13 family metallopeptidase [Acetobacter garciniae]|uniref:M13 family metallopeptidase n=1 Tax=Acetobacter garciniae TaxID=2817435 RepID=UPI002ED87CF0